MIKITLFLLLASMCLSCSESSRETATSSKSKSTEAIRIHENKVEDEDPEDGPPFRVDCPCSFEEIGKVRVSKERYDVLISGIGWNPDLKSCHWIWEELVNNEVPPDTLVTDLRIHLLDLGMSNQTMNKDFLQSTAYKENLIATYSQLPGEEYRSTRFASNRTGKYAEPDQ